MRAIIRRPVGRHFTSNVSANSEFCFQLELLKSSFFIARCFGPLSVVSDRPTNSSGKTNVLQIFAWTAGAGLRVNDEWRESLPRNQIVGFDQVKDDDAHHAHGLAPSLLPFSWILQSGASCFGAEGKAGLARAIRVALGAEASWASVVALALMAALLSSPTRSQRCFCEMIALPRTPRHRRRPLPDGSLRHGQDVPEGEGEGLHLALPLRPGQRILPGLPRRNQSGWLQRRYVPINMKKKLVINSDIFYFLFFFFFNINV